MRFEVFEGLGADAGDFVEVFGVCEGSVFDDAVGGGLADAGEFHEFAAGGGVGVDFFAVEIFGIVDADEILGVVVALGFSFSGEESHVGEGPDAAFVGGGLELEVIEHGLVFIGAEGGLVVGFAIDAEGAGVALFDQFLAEIFAIGGDDEGVDAGEIGIAAGIGEGGVNGEGFLEGGGDELRGFFTEGLGHFCGFLWIGVDFVDAEVAALGAEASGIGSISDVPLDAVDAVESDAEGFLTRGLDEEAIAIGPGSFLEGAVGVGGERLLRHRGGETEQEEEDGAEVIHGTRHKLYHEEEMLSLLVIRLR